MLSGKQIEKAMKKMGIKTEEIEAEEVVLKCKDKNIVISNPNVSKIIMGGQETFQISGVVSESSKEAFSKEDIDMIMGQTGCSQEEAEKALNDTGDIAAAILMLRGEK